jgi:hypothetical protein
VNIRRFFEVPSFVKNANRRERRHVLRVRKKAEFESRTACHWQSIEVHNASAPEKSEMRKSTVLQLLKTDLPANHHPFIAVALTRVFCTPAAAAAAQIIQ